ncbi:hypothetical protein BpHYR1_034251 [Brachionus plicatilis]|uniref:Uncharacterized protein n=1 Tax=Brachionus plicatilis TaxID=10195 RepID=A0A3M7RAD9_BRAPC|nr:hypothetical protein BpHYR1_034251 [Brachionus plicatilis]
MTHYFGQHVHGAVIVTLLGAEHTIGRHRKIRPHQTHSLVDALVAHEALLQRVHRGLGAEYGALLIRLAALVIAEAGVGLLENGDGVGGHLHRAHFEHGTHELESGGARAPRHPKTGQHHKPLDQLELLLPIGHYLLHAFGRHQLEETDAERGQAAPAQHQCDVIVCAHHCLHHPHNRLKALLGLDGRAHQKLAAHALLDLAALSAHQLQQLDQLHTRRTVVHRVRQYMLEGPLQIGVLAHVTQVDRRVVAQQPNGAVERLQTLLVVADQLGVLVVDYDRAERELARHSHLELAVRAPSHIVEHLDAPVQTMVHKMDHHLFVQICGHVTVGHVFEKNVVPEELKGVVVDDEALLFVADEQIDEKSEVLDEVGGVQGLGLGGAERHAH